MDAITASEFETMIAGASVLAADDAGVGKVFRLADGRIAKLFRSKRGVSSAMLRPYAGRFAGAARRLAALGVPTVAVERVFRVVGAGRQGVVYRPLEGEVVRDLVATREDPLAIMGEVAALFARLHGLGVYFRGLHLGNVVMTDDGPGVIDVSDMRFGRGPLGSAKRVRNFRPMLRYPEDVAALRRGGGGEFLEAYCRATGLPDPALGAIVAGVIDLHEVFRDGAP